MRTLLFLSVTGLACFAVGTACAEERGMQTGWHTGACGFVPAMSVPSVPAITKNPMAPDCCYVPVTMSAEDATRRCLERGWRLVNGEWYLPR